jgi:soluble lytic murein transglycosylase-like protein/Flp pilus assembly protein TadD
LIVWTSLAALAGVPELVATGDCAGLAATPPVAGDALARAWCAHRDGRPDAIPALLGTPDGLLADYERWLLGRAALARGNAAEAHRWLGQLTLPGSAGTALRVDQAEALWTQDPAAARVAMTALTQDPTVGRAATFALAQHAEPATAIPALQRLWTDARPGGWDVRAADALAQLGAPVPRLSDLDGRRLAYARFESLADAARAEEALALLVDIRANGGKFSDITLAHAQFAARRYPDAAATYGRTLGVGDAASGTAADLFEYALAIARTGDYSAASVLYRRVLALHPTSDEADFASYKLGYMPYDRGDCDSAVTLLRSHVTLRPQSKRVADALWFVARCQQRTGDLRAASLTLADLVRRRPDSDLVPGAVYWQASWQSDPAVQRSELDRVLRTWPTSGWAWMAAERLGTVFPAPPPISAPAFPAPPPAVRRAIALLQLGLTEWAAGELEGVAPANREQSIALAWLRASAGDWRGARRAVQSWCVEPWKGGDPRIQQVCVPRPAREVVTQVAASTGMDPNLAYAIMTAESNLNPTVTSPAGARGLMQLMPSLAATLHAERYPDRPFSPDDLYTPAYNASLGTRELALRWAQFGQSLRPSGAPATIASYNAGIDAVNRWLGAGTNEFDAFAEDIGFPETRLYVRRVLGFWMAYRWVYGDPPAP